jgi:hypothetical protein
MLLQNKILWAAGAVVLTLGAVANLKYYGLIAAGIYSLIVCIATYLLTYNIHCIIHGRCYATAWFNMLLGLFTLSGVLMYYIIALKHGDLPKLLDQHLLKLIPVADTTAKYVETNYGVHIDKVLNWQPPSAASN